jgi:hypothetical protein
MAEKPEQGRPSLPRVPNLSKARFIRISTRWARVFGLSVIGAVVFELLLPWAWSYAKTLPLDYSPAFASVVIWITSFSLFYVVSEPIRIRSRQWRYAHLYPPTWLAVPLACLLAAASGSLPIGLRPHVTGPDWRDLFPVGPIVFAFIGALVLRQLRWRHSRPSTILKSVATDGNLSWEQVEAWVAAGEHPVSSDEPDFFNHRPLAHRMVQTACIEGRPVALLGRFGTGKSSILNVVRTEARTLPRPVIVADLDVWAVRDPEDVPRLALNRIVSALDDYVDTIEFRAVPASYQRLAAAEPTGRLSGLLGLDGPSESLDELERLAPVLDALDARVLLIVEDLERAGESFETRHLARLLWALRRLHRSSFILAVDPDHVRLDFPKLCDTIERVPSIEVRQVARILTVAFAHWRTQYSFIDPHPNRKSDNDKLRLEHALMEGLMDYMRKTGRDTPLDALVALLETPRQLKHVVRRVDRTWRNLHGEVELDDVVIVSALRHAAEPLFEYLLASIEPARHKPDDALPRTQTVKDEWDALVKAQPNGGAAQRLVDLMGIEQLTRGIAINATTAPQGVHVDSPRDYFFRIVAEELAPGEVRDQEVLRDIERWQSARQGPLIARLLQASTDEQYQRVWEHFEKRHSTEELLEMTSTIVRSLLERDGAGAADDHPAVLGLWRSLNRRPWLPQFPSWLRDLILSAVPMSLRMVDGLYYYWTGQRGIVNADDAQAIRHAITDAVRSTIRTPADLARITEPGRPWEIGRFITQTGRRRGPDVFAEWRDFLAPLLLDGAPNHPETMIPALANLAGDEQSGIVAAGVEPPVFINRYKIERAKFEAFLGDRLEEGLHLLAGYAGDNPYAVRAKEDAALWLAERRGELREPSREGATDG